MSHQQSSSAPANPHPAARALALAQQLPPDVVTLIAHFASTDNDVLRYETDADLRRGATSFAQVCRAWRAAGTAAFWRQIVVSRFWPRLRAQLLLQSWVLAYVRSVVLPFPYGWEESRVSDAAILAACPLLTRLEICGYYGAPGPLLRHLQEGFNLAKIDTVVVNWPLFDRAGGAGGGAGRPGAPLSPLVLFPFLRSCTNLQSFHYQGWAELVSSPSEALNERRIRLRSLRLDISNSATSPHESHAHRSRMRFLLNFDLSRLVKFRAMMHLGRAESWDAIGRMVNVEVLSLLDDFKLEQGGFEELIEHLPRLRRLRRFELFIDNYEYPASPSSASHEQLQRLLDAIPPSVTHILLQVPIPESMAGDFFAQRVRDGQLRRMTVITFDPLELAPTLSSSAYKHPDDDWFPMDDDDVPYYS